MLPEQKNTIKNAGTTEHQQQQQPKTIINLRSNSEIVEVEVEPKRKRLISFQDKLVEAPYRRGRRVHGLQLPLHPQQIFGWIVLLIFGFSAYFVLIPAFRVDLQGPLYGLLTGLVLIHIISHLTALLLDPADKELRRVHRNDRIVPEFDRTKHSHVIENGRCHLCNIRITGQRTKHCSVCNKCVGKFDHHCKWLNHCIGGRNYVSFLMCVVSAVVASLVILAAAISQLVLYHVDPSWLNFWWWSTDTTTTTTILLNSEPSNNETVKQLFLVPNNFSTNSNESVFLFNNNDTDTDTVINNNLPSNSTVESILFNITRDLLDADVNNIESEQIRLHDSIFLSFIGFLGVLAAVTAGLLLHLCFFHIYISFLGLTTFEYIRNQRANSIPATVAPGNGINPSDRKTDVYFCSSLSNPNDILEHNSDERRPSSLHCCENSREYHQTAVKTYYMCTMLKENAGSAAGYSDESSSTDDKSKSFHCCSQFARQTIQFTEQCTFCRVKMKESSKDGAYLKTISKHRWKRKWTCCGSVPDSPDVPNDILSSISRSVHENGKMNGDSNANQPKIHRRAWPVQRFRQIMRMLSRYRRPRCRHISTPAKSFKHTIKQNQIRPINTSSSSSSFTTEGSSMKSSDDDIATIPIETILPTTIIRSGNGELTMPVLPPPTRRKIPPNPTDLEELAETLSQQQQLRVPPVNYRRQRRKHFMRTRSPTLSPIHESGLSNPASPQPCRHTTTTTNCSPVIINKLCSSNNNSQQSLNKSSSNGSFTESSD